MSGNTMLYIVLIGILIIIAALVFSSLWFAFSVDKKEKSKHS